MSALGMGMSGMGPGGPPPSIQLGGNGAPGAGAPDDSSGGGDWEQDLQDAVAALRKLASDGDDHVDTNVVDKCIAALSAMLAQRQKGAESALGVTPAHKAMSRSY